MRTNPVARLAALLREWPLFRAVYDDTASPTQRQMDEAETIRREACAHELAKWLLARGVQYAPREPTYKSVSQVMREQGYEDKQDSQFHEDDVAAAPFADDARAAPLREPPQDHEAQIEAVRAALDKRLRDYDFTIRDGTYPRDLAEIAVDVLRPRGAR